jgi:hypothetical protein
MESEKCPLSGAYTDPTDVKGQKVTRASRLLRIAKAMAHASSFADRS